MARAAARFSRALSQPAYVAPRYTGIASFMRAPVVTEEADLTRHFADGGVAMFGVPFDGGVTNRPGARHGPREVRNASSLMRAVHPTSRINVFETCAIADAGDVPFSEAFVTKSCHDDTHAFASRLLRAGAVPLAVGGDHSISLPLLRAVCETQDAPVGLIHFDAHTDTWDSQWGARREPIPPRSAPPRYPSAAFICTVQGRIITTARRSVGPSRRG